MTDEERLQFREKLISEKEKINAEIETLEDKTKPISPENSLGRISRMDAINNKGVAEFALREAQRRLNAVNSWLSRFETDSFGKCARCKNDIPIKRLMYMPHSLKCMHCANR